MAETLVLFNAAKTALARATEIDEVKDVRDKAQALQLYARQRGESHEMQNDIAEIKVRAERRCGELLTEMEKAKAGRPVNNRFHDGTNYERGAPTLADLGIAKAQSSRWQGIAKLPERIFERHIAETKSNGAELTSAGLQRLAQKRKGNVHFSSESVECYTPDIILERVEGTMGCIDLDPCSNPGRPNVRARKHFTREDDGLSREWHGKVFMNPPYGREIADWVSRLCAQWEAGNVTEAIALVPARTDAKWFRMLREFPRCFVWGRLRFIGQENAAPFPSMAVYLGQDVTGFACAFGDIGDIYQLVEID